MKILIIDNYDSFTYNLAHYVEAITGIPPDVCRNDRIGMDEVGTYEQIILSPGPGLPEEAGILCDLIRKYAPCKRILGVCLGLQAIGEVFGGKLKNLKRVMHGVATPIKVYDPADCLFRGLPETMEVGRYHSWVVSRESLPDCFRITAVDEDGEIMGLTHQGFDVRGVQFHPESIMTGYGMDMLRNWLEDRPGR